MDSVDVIWLAKYVQTWTPVNHQHSFYQLTMLCNGSAAFHFQNSSFPMRKDCLYLCAPDQPHFVEKVSSTALTLLDIKFTISDPQEDGILQSLPCEILLDKGASFLNVLDDLIDEGMQKEYAYHTAINLKFHLLLLSLLRSSASMKAVESPLITRSLSDRDIERLHTFILKNLHLPLSVSELASYVCMNLNTFEKFFRKQFGLSPKQYINKLRLQQAKQMLVFDGMNATDISQHLGFQSLHYFSRWFKQRTGLSPLAYRSSQRDFQSIRLDEDKIRLLAPATAAFDSIP